LCFLAFSLMRSNNSIVYQSINKFEIFLLMYEKKVLLNNFEMHD
jgi:hypothetical protein